MKKKILYFGSSPTSYPNSRAVEVLVADCLAQKGNGVTLCVGSDVYYKKENPDNLTIKVIPNLEQQQINKKTERDILSTDYEVVFASSVIYTSFANYFAKKKGVQSIVQVLDIPLWRLHFKQWAPLWQKHFETLKETDVIIANTSTTKELLMSVGFAKEKIKVIYFGINSVMAQKTPKQECDNSICTVSRCVFYKAFDLALYSLKMSKIESQLKIIGYGEEYPKLVQLAVMLGANAKFVGPIPDNQKFEEIKKSLFSIYLNVCPTMGGLFPLESLVCGKPCIVWDTPINHDIYKDYVEYVPLYDVKALSEKIKSLVDNSDWREDRGEKGKDWVLKNRTYDLHAEKLMEVFSHK